MKGFALDDNGDVIIQNNKNKIIQDTELIRQNIKTILSTNNNEWFLNTNEGINFNNILGKKKDDEIIKNEILQGIRQVDDTFVLESFNCDFDKKARKLKINFTARNSKGVTIEHSTEY